MRNFLFPEDLIVAFLALIMGLLIAGVFYSIGFQDGLNVPRQSSAVDCSVGCIP